MKKKRIRLTVGSLRKLNPCEKGIERFLGIFKSGRVLLSKENVSKFKFGDLDWLCSAVLLEPAYKKWSGCRRYDEDSFIAKCAGVVTDPDNWYESKLKHFKVVD